MAGGANHDSRSLAGSATSVFDDIDAGWEDAPESTSFPVRQPASGIAPAKSEASPNTSRPPELVDEPTLEISESFVDELGLEGIEAG